MTKPHSSILASRIEPHLRDYIDARINEEIKPMRDDIAACLVALSLNNGTTEVKLGEQAARLNDIDALLSLPSYKVVKLLELAQKD
mgnify:FL=1|tara:strand:+ start:185 stop:442 length:258 start_codon:yes stop_codon:yes gene_type:complete